MMNGSLLRVFALEYDAKTNSISPHVRYISPDNVLHDLYKIINCGCVTCRRVVGRRSLAQGQARA